MNVLEWAKLAFEVGSHTAGLIWRARGKKERMQHRASQAKAALDKLFAEAEAAERGQK